MFETTKKESSVHFIVFFFTSSWSNVNTFAVGINACLVLFGVPGQDGVVDEKEGEMGSCDLDEGCRRHLKVLVHMAARLAP